MKDNKLFTVRWLITVGLAYILNNMWQLLEVMYYGEVQPSVVDTIISIPIMFSIYLNVKHWIKDVI